MKNASWIFLSQVEYLVAVKGLSCYVYISAIWTYLTTVNQGLIMLFSQRLCVIGKISIRWSEKKHKTIEKVEMWKLSTVNRLFLTNNYIYIINLLLKNRLTVVIFLLMRETSKNLVWQEKLYLFSHTTWLLFLFNVNFWCYDWLSSG